MEISMNTNDAARANEKALPEKGNGVSDLLRRAIERHDAAEHYFNSVCYLEEDSILGREPTPAELALKNAASDAADAAMTDVCYFPARTPEDLAAKARHLRKYHSHRMGSLPDFQVENLLRSMLPAEERDAIDDAPDKDDDNLAFLIANHVEITAAINRTDGDPDEPKTVALCERQCKNALLIISHRPHTKADERRKAEFLREWTEGTNLTEEEQDALIASMLPEGGEA
jgi:hypothetical protein